MTVDADDRGHRHGNFPNYYAFHPPTNRIQVLEESNILSYIREGLRLSDDEYVKKNSDVVGVGGVDVPANGNTDKEGKALNGSVRKKPRLDQKQPVSTTNTPRPAYEIYYCDLGCNEGDLTMAMASSLIAKQSMETTQKDDTDDGECDKDDDNDYENDEDNGCEASPPSPNTQEKAKTEIEAYYKNDLTDTAVKLSFDNNFEGNVLSANEEEKQQQISLGNQHLNSGECTSYSVKCLGLDLDPMLIERANTKYSSAVKNQSNITDEDEEGSNNNEGNGSAEADISSSSHAKSCTAPLKDSANYAEEKTEAASHDYCNVSATFKVCNLCSESEHNDAYKSFWDEVVETSIGNGNNSTTNESKVIQQFHLTTIFSTTMWIHVHSGDVGLKQFLERACRYTKRYLLVEPQPSAW